MSSLVFLADISLLPPLVFAGAALIVVAGFFLSIAILVAGAIRKNRRRERPESKQGTSET